MSPSAMESARSALEQPPSGMAVITPSYLPDRDLFADLHASVLRNFATDVVHTVVVPKRDLRAFSEFVGPRCRVLGVDEVLPPVIRSLPRLNMWVNSRAPWPPLRGWIVQQLAKFGVVDHVDADVLVLADSDVIFIRPVTIGTFTRNGSVALYTLPEAITSALPKHMIWVEESRRMLGLPAAEQPHADFIFSPNSWDRRLVLAMRQRIEETTGRAWSTEMGKRLHVSECMLYGMFAQAASGGRHPGETSTMHCHTYWDEVPLDLAGSVDFLSRAAPDDIAVMWSAKSHTPLDVRRSALRTVGFA